MKGDAQEASDQIVCNGNGATDFTKEEKATMLIKSTWNRKKADCVS